MEEKQISDKKEHPSLWPHIPDDLTDRLGFRIMGLFLTILVFGTIIFEVFYVRSLYDAYYDNVSGTLLSQARYDGELFLSYVSDNDINTVVLENKNQFYRSSNLQVQILNNSGIVLSDNQGTSLPGTQLKTSDILSAQKNYPGLYVGPVSYSNETVMSLSYPLRNQTDQVGILRLTTSLKEINHRIQERILLSLAFCLFVIASAGVLSFLMSRSIVHPIRNLTDVALKFSDGYYQERADETSRGEIGELARTMNQMSDNIQEKENLKNEFISSVSHELRTPLTSIKGWAITLQSEGIKPELVNDGLKIIEKESERLGAMVEELLDFSRFSAGRLKMEMKNFNLIKVANHILIQMRPRVEEKKLHLNYNYDQPELMIRADEGRIKQVLLNLLDNAIKFTNEDGTIYLNISTTPGFVRVSVTDTGIGISENEIGLVTEKFWKGSSSQSHSGLGLSISEEIVKAHGGTLSIKSKLGAGTSVSITLPIGTEEEEIA